MYLNRQGNKPLFRAGRVWQATSFHSLFISGIVEIKKQIKGKSVIVKGASKADYKISPQFHDYNPGRQSIPHYNQVHQMLDSAHLFNQYTLNNATKKALEIV